MWFANGVAIGNGQLATGDDGNGCINGVVIGDDNQIDKLLYELYGLSDEEITIVEGAE